MNLATVAYLGRERLGIVNAPSIILLDFDFGGLDDLIERQVGAAGIVADGQGLPLSDVRLLSPLRRFRANILCAGWNYWDHFEEGKGRREGQDVERPVHPTFFSKRPNVVVGPNAPIAFDDSLSGQWDYEAELALVIGRDGRNIPEDRALDHVFGYCLANDISQRDIQRAHGGQWLKGKSVDGTMPFGPWIVTSDSIDPTSVTLECWLNGERVQMATTRQMAFPISRLIAELSRGMTLLAGDVLLTGTPAGVGNARTPPLYLVAGDEVITRGSNGLGELHNRLEAVDLHSPTPVGWRQPAKHIA